MLRHLCSILALSMMLGTIARAQDVPPPAYLAVVEGAATVERDGALLPATVNMPFVPGDRLRTTNGRVQIAFPDGSAIEVAEDSEIECITPTRVRLIAGTMDHLQQATPQSASASYLPHGLDMYGSTLDQNGAWQYAAPYGYVWYPTVAPDWRPYYYGYWSPVRTYGWTWVGVDSWAWATHHYGRWGHASNRWFWIPGRTWGPAWVSWAAAADYVSWCPLGFDSRPVFALSLGQRNTWAGWTVLPRANFGSHQYYAHRNALDSRRIPVNTPFIALSTQPLLPGRSPATRIDNGRVAAGGVAVPRQSPVAGRQLPVEGRPSAVNRQAPAGARQAPVVEGREAPSDGRQPRADRGWSRNPQTGVETHYGVAVPRTTMEAPPNAGQSAAPVYRSPTPNYRPPTPDYRPPAPDYRPPTPDYRAVVPERYRPGAPEYRSPNGYGVQRMDPRVTTPMPSAPPPSAAAPSAAPAPPPVAMPRAAAPDVRSGPPPPQAGPPAGSAPARGQGQGASQGEARPRGEARPAESRRPR